MSSTPVYLFLRPCSGQSGRGVLRHPYKHDWSVCRVNDSSSWRLSDKRGRQRRFPTMEGAQRAILRANGGWAPYGDDGESTFVLIRGPHNRCKWVLRDTGEQVGPLQSNVAPALAWALYSHEAPGELLAEQWGRGRRKVITLEEGESA